MDNEPRLMFVYEKNGVICGYYSLLMQDNNECELNNLAVFPEYRHSGFGKRLLEHIKTATLGDLDELEILDLHAGKLYCILQCRK